MEAAGLKRLLGLMGWKESIASVSLSHEQSCKCDVCKAAKGDEAAFSRVVDQMERGQ